MIEIGYRIEEGGRTLREWEEAGYTWRLAGTVDGDAIYLSLWSLSGERWGVTSDEEVHFDGTIEELGKRYEEAVATLVAFPAKWEQQRDARAEVDRINARIKAGKVAVMEQLLAGSIIPKPRPRFAQDVLDAEIMRVAREAAYKPEKGGA